MVRAEGGRAKGGRAKGGRAKGGRAKGGRAKGGRAACGRDRERGGLGLGCAGGRLGGRLPAGAGLIQVRA